MAFSDYTTTDEVRSLLGVSSKELKDEVIATNTTLVEILERLEETATDFAAVFAAARDAEPRTSQQNRLVLLAESFCAYTAALKLATVVPVAAPQTISDGKAERTRVDNPYEHLVADLTAGRDYVKMRMKLAYNAVTGGNLASSTSRRVVAVVSPAIDPITG